MDELPHLRLLTKIAVFFCWSIGSALTLMAAFFVLLNAPGSHAGTRPLFEPKQAYHLFQAQPESGQVLGEFIGTKDARIEILKNYLRVYHSPLADHADALVQAADTYQLPWTLLPAIAGKESGFGKVVPDGSFNAWGWGVYTGQNSGVSFTSWPEAIEGVAQGIRQDYFNQDLDTVEKMEPRYTPSSLQRGHTWSNGVNYFIWEIENFTLR